jgi:hydroxyacylglutathione hydrolase
LSIEPNNVDITKKLKWAQQQIQSNEPTVPSTIAEELLFNPFLRVHEPTVQQSTKQNDPIECMRVLREKKDAW